MRTHVDTLVNVLDLTLKMQVFRMLEVRIWCVCVCVCVCMCVCVCVCVCVCSFRRLKTLQRHIAWSNSLSTAFCDRPTPSGKTAHPKTWRSVTDH